MPPQNAADNRPRRLAGLAAAGVLAMALFAANTMATGLPFRVPGSEGSHAPPEQTQAWTRYGKSSLGETAWNQAIRAATSRGPTPWWFGILIQD